MIAYARMQFSEMQPSEREELVKGLLRYCELDTFAMVMCSPSAGFGLQRLLS